ncbi:CcmD family protein [Acidobacteria bacterium AH-259-O06]|nr:CcmD family protein [Acidobacteria bacterium AH-259-G07]MDA2930476.1 CcmD family protein [Acidobacteria bacterium AH-259-O06]MDA2937574.1 CcmD family protein [Acidobacteria bacterium AH-259-A15]
MTYLFWAQTACWIVLFVYIVSLIRKTENLKRQVAVLRNASTDSAKEGVGEG